MLRITRRDFLKYCSVAAGALGLSASTLMKVENALAKDVTNGGVPVIWISGAACTGCTMSLANTRFYTTVDDLLLNRIDLRYLDTLMSTAGAYVDGSVYEGANSLTEAKFWYDSGLPYVLAVEGAIQAAPPPGGTGAGDYCRIGDLTGTGDETMLGITRAFASKALAVLAIGTCSSFGGIPNGRGSATNAKGLLCQGTSQTKGALTDASIAANVLTGVPAGAVAWALDPTKTVPVVNISGCPPHPDWIVGTIANILDTLPPVSTLLSLSTAELAAAMAAALPSATSYNRPSDYGYREYQCNAGPCPWRYNNTTGRKYNNSGATDNSATLAEPDWNRRYPVGNSRALGKNKWTGTDLGCLGILGCKGRKTKADCSKRRWNTDVAEEYGVNWCVGSRGNCQGCTEPTFPDKVGKFYTFI